MNIAEWASRQMAVDERIRSWAGRWQYCRGGLRELLWFHPQASIPNVLVGKARSNRHRRALNTGAPLPYMESIAGEYRENHSKKSGNRQGEFRVKDTGWAARPSSQSRAKPARTHRLTQRPEKE